MANSRGSGISGAFLALVTVIFVACQGATPSMAPGASGDAAPGSSGEPAPVSTVIGDGNSQGPVGAASEACAGAEVPGVAEAQATIQATNLADEASIQAVEQIRFTDAGVAAAARSLAADVGGDALWAATWIYASSACPVANLTPLLANEDATLRAMAAAAHVAWGEPAGFPVLRALLASDGMLRGSTPPLPLAVFASGTLAAYVDGPSIPEDADSATVNQSWSAWLDEHTASLVWNAATGRWRVP